jgi:hypothetical protein
LSKARESFNRPISVNRGFLWGTSDANVWADFFNSYLWSACQGERGMRMYLTGGGNFSYWSFNAGQC